MAIIWEVNINTFGMDHNGMFCILEEAIERQIKFLHFKKQSIDRQAKEAFIFGMKSLSFLSDQAKKIDEEIAWFTGEKEKIRMEKIKKEKFNLY